MQFDYEESKNIFQLVDHESIIQPSPEVAALGEVMVLVHSIVV